MDSSNSGIFYSDLMGEFDINISDQVAFTDILVDSVSENTPGNTVVFGSTITSRNIIPDIDDTRDLGSPSKRFQNAYIDALDIDSLGPIPNIQLTDTSNQIIVGATAGNKVTLNMPTPSANRIHTLPDVGADADFVMTRGAQTIISPKTFSSQIAITPTTNQIVFGSTNTITINSAIPGSSRTYLLPDVGSDTTFAMLGGTIQTFDGTKIFTNPVSFTALTNQLVIGDITRITLSAPAPASSLTYTIPDATENADILLSSLPSGKVIRVLSNGTDSFVVISGTAASPGKQVGFQFQRNNTLGIEGAIGLSAASNNIVSGSVAGDLCLQSFSNILFGATGTTYLKLDGTRASIPLTTASTSQTTGALIVSGGIGAAKDCYLKGVAVDTSGGTPTVINYFEETTHTTNFTGAFSISNVVLRVKRFNNTVKIAFAAIQGTSVSINFLIASTALPTRFRPATEQTIAIRGIAAGTIQMITARIRTDGVIRFERLDGTGFLSGGTCGTAATNFSYDLDL